MDSWIVCPCQCSRLTLLKRMLKSLEHPKDHVVVVSTLPEPVTRADVEEYADHVVLCPFSEMYIAKWWNTGLDYVDKLAEMEHEVLVISSDWIGNCDSVAMLANFLRANSLTMVGPNPHSPEVCILELSTPPHPHSRVPGGCWMIAGESGLRVDEEFRWWYSDDDFDMQARKRSGSGIIPGTGLVGAPDTALSDLQVRWAQEDRQRFVSKWGREPW